VNRPDGPPHRIAVLSAGAWNAATLQLALATRALAERGLVSVVGCVATREWQGVVPGVRVVPLELDAGLREQRSAVAPIVGRARATVVLTDDEVMRRAAVRAVEPGACVLQRLPLGGTLPEDTVASRFAARRMHLAWLVPSVDRTTRTEGTPSRVPTVSMPIATPNMEWVTPLERVPQASAPARTLVVVANPEAPATALPALRAAAQVARRHAELRIRLLGTPTTLQGLQVHAAALRVASQVEVGPLPVLTGPGPVDGCATWVAAGGDLGVTAALWSMAAGVPVVVSSDSVVGRLVGATGAGLVLRQESPVDDAAAAAALARLLGHARERWLMGDAACDVALAHADGPLADAVLLAIEQASGVRGTVAR
jgi:hypothetical protein